MLENAIAIAPSTAQMRTLRSDVSHRSIGPTESRGRPEAVRYERSVGAPTA